MKTVEEILIELDGRTSIKTSEMNEIIELMTLNRRVITSWIYQMEHEIYIMEEFKTWIEGEEMKKLVGNTENKLVTWIDWDGKRSLTQTDIGEVLQRMKTSVNANLKECSAPYHYDQYEIDRMTASKGFYIK